MSFSQYILEEKQIEEFGEMITELFGGESRLSRRIAAKDLLNNKINPVKFSRIFAEPLIANILKILPKLPQEQKKDGAYLAYLILQKQGKDSKWFKMFKKTNQKLLTHSDEMVKKGAHLAKRDIEKARPEK